MQQGWASSIWLSYCGRWDPGKMILGQDSVIMTPRSLSLFQLRSQSPSMRSAQVHTANRMYGNTWLYRFPRTKVKCRELLIQLTFTGLWQTLTYTEMMPGELQKQLSPEHWLHHIENQAEPWNPLNKMPCVPFNHYLVAVFQTSKN